MFPDQDARQTSSARQLLPALIRLDILAFGIAPALLWALAAVSLYGLRQPVRWLIYVAPAEGFLGYGMLSCIPLELVRIGLIIFGARVLRGRQTSLRPFLLLMMGLAVIEPLAAAGLLAISNQGGAVWASLVGHALLSTVLVSLTFSAARSFRSSADRL